MKTVGNLFRNRPCKFTPDVLRYPPAPSRKNVPVAILNYLDYNYYLRLVLVYKSSYDTFLLSTRQVSRVYDEALKKEGLLEVKNKPAVISDNGPRFIGRGLTGLLDELGVEHRTIPVGHPETNGKMEVFHKTLKYEQIYLREIYETIGEAREDIDNFIEHYNSKRLHQAIGYVTPNQKHRLQAQEIIEERKRNHRKAIKRRKRINREKAEIGKTKKQIKESV